MWMVTVKPEEDSDAWTQFVSQGVIGIGWPSRSFDDLPVVRRFHSMQPGDWVVAHVPASHGGEPCLARGIARITNDYEEVMREDLPNDDHWTGSFRRQFRVDWQLGDRSLRNVVGSFQGTVRRLNPTQANAIRRLYG